MVDINKVISVSPSVTAFLVSQLLLTFDIEIRSFLIADIIERVKNEGVI